MTGDLRTDPWLGTLVHVVASRQNRPNLPASGCPFCVGGLEADEPYSVKVIPNRWPPMPDGRCEVVLYASDHDARLATLDRRNAGELVDVWAGRTELLGARDDVDFVLVFENSGREVGATIDHPHGQIYAFDHVPERPRRRLASRWRPDRDPARLIVERDGWAASVPYVSAYPLAIEIAPLERLPDLPGMDREQRAAFATILQDILGRIERLHDLATPTMMWFNQRPSVDPSRAGGIEGYHDAWFNAEIVSPWRSPNVMRYIAAAEVATGEYFVPVVPEQLAERLRGAG